MVVGCARVHLVFRLLSSISLHQAASPQEGGNEQHMYRSSAGPRAHTGDCWEPWLPWEQQRVPLYFPSIFLYCNIHKMSVTIMSCRRTLSQAVFTEYLFKKENYLPICLADFQPLVHHTGMLYKFIYCHKNLGVGERWKKLRNVFKSLM